MKCFCFLFSLCLSIITAQAQDIKPINFTNDKTTPVFLKAEMVPSQPDLERRYMRWCNEGIYVDRQFTAEGATGRSLIQAAYKVSGDRVIDKANLTETLYSVEVVVPEGRKDFLIPLLKQTIHSGLGVTSTVETVEMEVGVLRHSADQDLGFEKLETDRAFFRPGTSKVEGHGQPIGMLVAMLSNSSLAMPVLDETGIEGTYQFSIEWQEGNRGSLKAALSDVGLSIDFEQRPMEMVVIRKAE